MGPKYSKLMKQISAAIAQMSQADIVTIETQGAYEIQVENEKIILQPKMLKYFLKIFRAGWLQAKVLLLLRSISILQKNFGRKELKAEFVNRIQNIRKESDFEVTDKIKIQIQKNELFNDALLKHSEYISNQTLASSFVLVEKIDSEKARQVDIDEVITYLIEKQ